MICDSSHGKKYRNIHTFYDAMSYHVSRLTIISMKENNTVKKLFPSFFIDEQEEVYYADNEKTFWTGGIFL